MLNKFIVLVLMVLSFNVYAQSTFENGILKLDGDNFFAISGEFNDQMADDFLTKIFTYDKKRMFLYFDSPGGSVVSMLSMTRQMQNSNIEFICVAKEAASAAFVTFQYCTKRYILPDGFIMSHDASGTFEGEFTRMKERLATFSKLIEFSERHVAHRMKLSYNDYIALIVKELWLTQNDAIKMNASDDTAKNVFCSKELTEKIIIETVVVHSFLGSVINVIKKSACPLIYEQTSVK